MGKLQEEFQRRLEDRKRSKLSSWVSVFVKILLFLFVFALIRVFTHPDSHQLFEHFRQEEQEQQLIIE
jgi:uncharacterized membrane protein